MNGMEEKKESKKQPVYKVGKEAKHTCWQCCNNTMIVTSSSKGFIWLRCPKCGGVDDIVPDY